MIQLFFSVFALIFIAELPDKTALATLVLATRNNWIGVLVGACAALAVQSAIAVTAGSALALLPQAWVHGAAGVLFILFAIMMWRKKVDDDDEAANAPQMSPLKAAASSFAVVFLAEWGDFTQLATAALAARYNQPLLIFVASTLALWSVTALGVMVGHNLKRILNPQKIERCAAVLFMGVGIFILVFG